jgi:hypothetical protein
VRRICKDCAEIPVPVQTLLEEGFTAEEAKTVKIQKAKAVEFVTAPIQRALRSYEVREVDDEIRNWFWLALALELKKKLSSAACRPAAQRPD